MDTSERVGKMKPSPHTFGLVEHLAQEPHR